MSSGLFNNVIYKMCLEIICILFTNPSARAGYDTSSIFLAEFNRFEFNVFLHQD